MFLESEPHPTAKTVQILTVNVSEAGHPATVRLRLQNDPSTTPILCLLGAVCLPHDKVEEEKINPNFVFDKTVNWPKESGHEVQYKCTLGHEFQDPEMENKTDLTQNIKCDWNNGNWTEDRRKCVRKCFFGFLCSNVQLSKG